MKIFAFFILGAAVLLAGCDSISTRMEDRFSPVPPQTRIFAASRKQVFEAGQQAVKNVGLLLGHVSLTQGRIEGYARITAGDATRDTQQTTIEINLTEADAGGTQVGVLVWEQTEGNFPGGVTKQAQRQHSLYEIYFAALQQVLQEKGYITTGATP